MPTLQKSSKTVFVKRVRSRRQVNYADVTIRWGLYESAIRFVGYPIVPGFDFAGVVEASGDPAFAAGDDVLGITFFGAYSARVLVPARQCRRRPAALPAADAAALPGVVGRRVSNPASTYPGPRSWLNLRRCSRPAAQSRRRGIAVPPPRRRRPTAAAS